MDARRMGFGMAGAVDRSVIERVAARVETAGFATFWLNDTPDGDALAGLATAARATTTIRLATGVIPLDRQDAAQIARRVRELQLPEERLTLGVGSGRAANALDLVESEVIKLKQDTSGRVAVGALGPRMRAVALRVADELLLNWLSVDGARDAVEATRMQNDEARRSPFPVALYVRAALGEAATQRLMLEADRYQRIPSYAANFARLGVDAIATTVSGPTPVDITEGLEPFTTVVDEPIVRGVTARDMVEEYQALIDAVVGVGSHAETRH